MSKYRVPEEGLEAFKSGFLGDSGNPIARLNLSAGLRGLDEFVRWQSENGPRPTKEQLQKLVRSSLTVTELCNIWREMMYVSPEPEIPEEVKDLLTTAEDNRTGVTWTNDGHDRAVIEAFNRGRKGRP